MDKLSAIIKQKKEAVAGNQLILRGEIEEKRRRDYEERQKEVEKIEQENLGKRL